jgi:hypothetical protein
LNFEALNEEPMSELTELEYTKNVIEGPQSVMEKILLEEYLKAQGYTLKEVHDLPEEKARELMTKASQYASLKMAQVESSAHFRDKIRGPS